MRWEVINQLSAYFLDNLPKLETACVVGGSSNDPEVKLLDSLVRNELGFHYFGIDNFAKDPNWNYLDLNSNVLSPALEFDIVLCSHVLEHIWNVDSALNNLSKLTKRGGYLVINCPTSNFAHGSPNYYSAGYSSAFIAENLRNKNFQICLETNFGTKRNYFLTHSLKRWLTESELKSPILNYKILPGSFLGKINMFRREFLLRLISCFFSDVISSNINYATETLVVARKLP